MRARDARRLHNGDEVMLKTRPAQDHGVHCRAAKVLSRRTYNIDGGEVVNLELLLNGGSGPHVWLTHDEVL